MHARCSPLNPLLLLFPFDCDAGISTIKYNKNCSFSINNGASVETRMENMALERKVNVIEHLVVTLQKYVADVGETASTEYVCI